MDASWVAQTVEADPQAVASVYVGGNSYLIPGSDSSGLTLIKAAADGMLTEYPLVGDVQPKSVAVAGSKIFMTGIGYDGVYKGLLQVFDTATGTLASQLFVDPAVTRGPRYGAGALAPDGLVYFPPMNSMVDTECSVLVVDPDTEAVSFTTFGGTYVPDYYGHACVGGDGRMYFLPGLATGLGGVSWPGSRIGRIDFSTGAFTAATPPNEPPHSLPVDQFVWVAPAADGVYGGTARNNIIKITATAATVLWSNGGNPLQSSAATGPDGIVYVFGRDQSGTSGRDPMLVWIDPTTDVVDHQTWVGIGGPNFFPIVTFRVGSTIRAFTWGSSFPDILVVALGAAFNVALGAIPLTLAYGAVPLTAQIG